MITLIFRLTTSDCIHVNILDSFHHTKIIKNLNSKYRRCEYKKNILMNW